MIGMFAPSFVNGTMIQCFGVLAVVMTGIVLLFASIAAAPTLEDLLVLYLPDAAEWQAACAGMLAAGFERVTSFNP